jgi:hypothetical protein
MFYWLQDYTWRVSSSGIWRRVVRRVVPDVSCRNVGDNSTDYTASYPRRWYSSKPPLWKPQILHSLLTAVACRCRLLKPYIRRDMETTPLWLQLLSEVQAKANRNIPQWQPPPRHPIDYSYVRPQHVSSINSLCREFFYPGVDCKYICPHYCALCIWIFDLLNSLWRFWWYFVWRSVLHM